MLRHTLSMSRQSLLYSLLMAELLLQQTCLGSSHFFSILCRVRNLLLNNFYCHDIIFLCHDRDFCLQFFILSQHELFCCNILFVIFSTSVMTIFVFVTKKFTLASCCVCHEIKLLYCDNFFMPCLIVMLFSIAIELSFVTTEFI